MVGMSNTNKKQAMLFTNDWNDSVKLKKTINYQFYGWDLEYSSNDEVFWVMDSFNEMINFINYSTDKQFMDNISEYIDIDRAIDTMLYTIFIGGMDNISKNIMYVTYDGKKWIPNLYDLDSTWGLNWNGYIGISHNSNYEAYLDTTLWNRINKLYKDEIVSRYNELKTGPLAITNIEASFKEFNSSIPQMVFDYDAKKWPDMPHDYKNTLEYIKVWATDREYYLTEYFKKW